MWFKEKETLTEEDVQRGMKAIIKDGMASTAMATCTGGVFLTAFALALGASNSIIGLLAAIGPLVQLDQIPSIYLVEKIRNRRAIVVISSFIGRTFWLLIAAIPFIFSYQIGIKVLIFGMTMHALFVDVAGTAWGPWLRDILPQDKLGNFFSKRMIMSTVLGILLSLAAAFYIDQWKNFFPDQIMGGYSILFVFGFIAGMIGLYFLSTIPEPRMAKPEGKMNFIRMLGTPFKNENFKNLMLFSGSWTFAVNLAAPFFTVYMIKRLNMKCRLLLDSPY